MQVTLNISGFDSEAIFPDNDIEQVHKPLIEKFTRLYQEKGERVVVFLCAPPGTGKSTMASFWELLSCESESVEPLQVLPLDGFHYHNEFLDHHTIERQGETLPLRSIKGSFETFNLPHFTSKLKALKSGNPTWPFYDRNLHNPVEDAITVHRNIIVVEGNWLLLDEPEWRNLHQLSDLTIFVDTKPELLKERLIARKKRGGTNTQEALDFYRRTDSVNVEKVLNHSVKANITLFMNRDGSVSIS